MIDKFALKTIFTILVLALVVVQLHRNFGPLLAERSQMTKESLISLLVIAAAVFVYNCVGG